jgi:hypothetical protein
VFGFLNGILGESYIDTNAVASALRSVLFMAVPVGLGLTVLLWIVATVRVLAVATERTLRGTILIGLALLVLGPVICMVLIGLPILAGLYWMLMYHSLT